MAAKLSEIQSILKDLEALRELEGVALISRDGLLIADSFPRLFDRETFSAMSATMVAAAETATAETRAGAAPRITVETSNGRMLALAASSETLLVGIAGPASNVGALWEELGRAAERVRAVVGP